MKEKQIKTKQRVQEYGEVYTAEREVKAMCDLIPPEMWNNIESTFLEPACGTGNFLVEILSRKLDRCKDVKDGLKTLNSLFGVDILADNVEESRERLLKMFTDKFPEANDFTISVAKKLLKMHIVQDDFLNPQTEIVKSWGVSANQEYVKFLEKRKGGKS